MAILYYRNTHQGFTGYRVSGTYAGEHRVERFSTAPAKTQDESDPYVRYQWLKARLQEVEWEADHELHQYRVFVSEDDPKALPHQEVGCHAIFCEYFRSKWGDRIAGFRVRVRRSGRAPRFLFTVLGFSKAWRDAVQFWAAEHGIEEEDVQRLLRNPPEPVQFKRLRRYLNEHQGADIPTDALTPVFAEQRAEVAKQKALAKAKTLKLTEGPCIERQQDVEADMMTWFESETGSL